MTKAEHLKEAEALVRESALLPPGPQAEKRLLAAIAHATIAGAMPSPTPRRTTK